jgi:hypothetical protein
MSGLTNNSGFNFLGLTNLSTANLDSVSINTASILNLDGTVLTNCSTTTTPITGNAIVNKSYCDNNFMSLTEDNAYTGSLNDFLGTVITRTFTSTVAATFSGSCPSTAIDPTLNNHLVRNQYLGNTLLNYGLLGFPNTWDNSQTFSNLCIFNATSSFNGLATFNVCPKSTVNPVAGTNDLARVSYIENNFGIRQESNNWRQIQYFYEGIEVGNASGGNQNIQPNDGTNTFNLLTDMESIVNIGSFGDLSTWRYNTYLDLYKTTNITASTTLSFPLKNNYTIRTITTDITITLPAVTSFHHGLRINFFKTSSATQIVTLTPDATNKIIAGNSVTELTSDTISLGSGNLSTTLTVSRMNSGGYGWTSTSGTDYATLSGDNTFTGSNNIATPIRNGTNRILNSYRECGVYLINTFSATGFAFLPIFKSTPNLTNNYTGQAATSGAVSTAQSGTAVGSFSNINAGNSDNFWLVYPNYGLIAYAFTVYGGVIRINFKNLETMPVVVVGSTTDDIESIKIYYDGVEQT